MLMEAEVACDVCFESFIGYSMSSNVRQARAPIVSECIAGKKRGAGDRPILVGLFRRLQPIISRPNIQYSRNHAYDSPRLRE
jgi:hypothetical protein